MTPLATNARPWIILSILLLAGVSLVFRFLDLGRVPGINGDEGWYGVQVERRLAGEPYARQAPTGVLVDPFQPPTEALLIRLFGPSFLVLRLPVAIWQCVGLLAVLFLHRWVYGDWLEAALVALLLSAMPMHMGYSRFSWAPSYLLSTAALVLYPALRGTEHGIERWPILLLAAGAILSMWSHLTAVMCVALVLAAVATTGRRKLAELFRERRCIAAIIALLMLAVVAGGFLALCNISGRDPLTFIASAAQSVQTLSGNPSEALSSVTIIGDLVSGRRAFQYFAGLPDTSGLIESRIALVAVIVATITLLRSSRSADRAQAVLWFLIPWALLLTGSIYRLNVYGNERYVIWIVTAAAPLLVRGLFQLQSRVLPHSPRFVSAGILLAVTAFFLVQTWTEYFRPISTGSYRMSAHRTWWTGPQEPKAQAARLIATEAAALPAGTLTSGKKIEVYAQDWWLQYPVQYLLGNRFLVQRDKLPTLDAPWFAVTFTNSVYHESLVRKLSSSGQPYTLTSFPDADDPVVSVIVGH